MENDDESTTWTIFGSVGAALAAAVCCLGPVILVSLGIGGAWIGSLSALEAYRPIFMAVAAGLLGFGFYRVYGRSNQKECAEGDECETPGANVANQVSLWIATVAVVGLFASPYLLSLGLDDAEAHSTSSEASNVTADGNSGGQVDQASLSTTILKVEGMTCGGCVRTLESTLGDIDGVQKVQVTLEPPRANVTYDASKVSVDDLTEATGNVGFPSEPES